MPVNMDLLESVRRIEQEIREAVAQQKEASEEFKQAIAELPEYAAVEEAKQMLKDRKLDLNDAIKRDEECNTLRAQIDEGANKLTDLREILSHHLVRYREQSEHAFIEETDSKKVRPIILSAKLGKPEFQQEELPL